MSANSLYLEKLRQASVILQELDLDAWLIIERETALNADPIGELLWNFKVIWPAAVIVTADGQRIATGVTHDVPSFDKSGLFTEVVTFQKEPEETLPDIIKRLDPKTIALNYSEKSVAADGLTHGLYLKLMRMFEGTPYPERFVSAEDLIGHLRQRKNPRELVLLKEAAQTAHEIFEKFNQVIRPGMTETEMAAVFHDQIKKRGIGYSWDASQCPNMNAGPNTGRGHLGPQPDVYLEKGHILNIDFGVKQKGYCSDNQRMWYVLRDGECEPPENVQKHFYAVRDAIRAGFDALKPGVKGKDVDNAARQFLIDAGYPSFPHGLGHNVGRYAHDGGTGLGEKSEGLLEPNQVLTLELLVFNEYGYFSLEEEAITTETGAEWFWPPQEELMLVGSDRAFESYFLQP
jgi:Xaa-Pro aminopeptidase